MVAAVAGALQVILSPEELARVDNVPTVNMRAYNLYLIGNLYLRDNRNQTNYADAAQSFQSAVDEDPDFALAWAALSRAHSGFYFFVDHTEARRELAREAVERAFELQPDLAEAHFAMGYYYYHGFRDYENALREWAIAEQGMLGDSRLHLARAYLYRRAGELKQATASFDRASELDPRNIGQLGVLTSTYAQLHDYTRAGLIVNRMIEIAPDNPRAYAVRANLALWQDGDTALMKALLDAAPMKLRATQINWRAALYDRDYDAALGYLDNWGIDVVDSQRFFTPKASYYGITYQLAGMPELAAESFRVARTKVDRALESKPEDPRIVIALATILAYQGEGELAVNVARHAMELMPTSRDAFAGPPLHLNAIMVLIAAGDYGAAVEELDAYLAAPGQWSIEGLLPDPRLDPIRSDPRFAAVVEKYQRQ
jgi:tetratricopeptide (TPR) repeat protein